jgi:S1-C subfamily serine protease
MKLQKLRGVALLPSSLVFIALSLGSVTAQDCSKIVKSYRGSTVSLQIQITKTSNGAVSIRGSTGFIVSADGFVLTSYHAVLTDPSVERAVITGAIASSVAEKSPLTLIARLDLQDLALLKFDDTSKAYKPVVIGKIDALATGSPLCSMGFPKNYEFQTTHGDLGNRGGPGGFWTTQMPSNPGESGSPVFDRDLKVIAVKYGGDVKLQNVNLLVPITFANPLLGIANVQVSNSTAAPGSTETSCLDGDWKEQYENPAVWSFKLEGKTLKIKRLDNFVSGVLMKKDDSYIGELHWGNGDVWKDVVLTPTTDCSQVWTNQSWRYHR